MEEDKFEKGSFGFRIERSSNEKQTERFSQINSYALIGAFAYDNTVIRIVPDCFQMENYYELARIL